MENLYFRPEWTCGRYSKEKQVALMYNLIEGISYLFEDDSAEVIGEILSAEKNGQVSIEEVSLNTLIDKESLTPFFTELVQLGLLTLERPTIQSIDIYRKRIGKERQDHPQVAKQEIKEDFPHEISGAEKDYFDRVGGVPNVYFELTYNCSEKCIHCYNPGATRNDTEISERGGRIELDFDDYKQIIDELYDLGLTKVCLSGGDPFSKPIAWKIIDYLYNKGIATDILTNGQKLVSKVEKLAQYYPCTVGISIYSGLAEEHDNITRIKGSWKRSMNVIEQLAGFGIPMILICPIMRQNSKSYHLVADIAKQYGAITHLKVQIINSLDGDKCASQNLRLPTEVLELVLRDKNIPIYVGEENQNYGGKKLMRKPRCLSFCVTPEGNVQLCVYFPSPLGNLKKESFSHIFQKSEDLAWWRKITLKDFDECGKYGYCDFCSFCPGINFAENGTPLKAAETTCYLAKVRYNLAEKLKQGNDPLNGKTVRECLSYFSFPLSDLKQEKGHNYKNKKLTELDKCGLPTSITIIN